MVKCVKLGDKELFSKIVEGVCGEFRGVISIAVFGSFGRGEGFEDIDLLVV